MENYCDYVPTPEQIQAAKKADEERREFCQKYKYGIFSEIHDKQNNTGAESANVGELKGDNKTSLPALSSNRRDVKKSEPKKKPGRHKKDNNAPNKNEGQSSLF
jgi:hypothetical protein